MIRQTVRTILLFSILFLPLSVSAEQPVTVNKGKKITLDYTLTVDDEVIDTSVGKNPLQFVQGDGAGLIPGFVRQIEGMQVGESKSIKVSPEEGYGAVDAKAFIEAPKTILPTGMDPQVGTIIEVEQENGQTFPATIWEIKENTVVLNFNHPLAGKELQFEVKIIAVE